MNADRTATLYAVTSTEGRVLGDSGADPNQIVAITDNLGANPQARSPGESFDVLNTSALCQLSPQPQCRYLPRSGCS